MNDHNSLSSRKNCIRRRKKLEALKRNEEIKTYIKKSILSGNIPCKREIRSINKSSLLNIQKNTLESESIDTEASTDNESESSVEDLSYNVVYWLMSYQLSAAKRIWRLLLRIAVKSGKSQISTLLQQQQLKTFFTFIMWHFLIDFGIFKTIVPVVAFVYLFLMMMTSTLQTVHQEDNFQLFIEWSDSLHAVDELINKEEAEKNFFLKNTPPIKRFIFGIFGTIIFYPICFNILPISYLCTASAIAFITSMWSFSSIAAHPFFLLYFFLVCLESYLSHFNLLKYSIHKFNLFYFVNISLTTHSILKLFAIIFIIFLVFTRNQLSLTNLLKKKQFKHDFNKIIILFVWLQLTILLAKSVSSMNSLFMCMFQLLLVIFLFPIACFWLLVTTTKFLILVFGLKKIFFFVFIVTLLVLVLFHKSKITSVYKNYFVNSQKRVLFVLFFLIVSLSSSMFNTFIKKNLTPIVVIEKYSQICMKNTDLALEQLACRQLTGFQIELEGYVEKTSLASVVNKASDLTSKLPVLVADYIDCFFGDTYPNDEICSRSYNLQRSERSLCNIPSVILDQKKCHLNRYNEYTFVIEINVGQTNTISIEADDSHAETVFSLKKEEKVAIKAVVENDGKKLSLMSINKEKSTKHEEKSIKAFSKSFSAIECCFNFFFSPLLTLNLLNKNNIC